MRKTYLANFINGVMTGRISHGSGCGAAQEDDDDIGSEGEKPDKNKP